MSKFTKFSHQKTSNTKEGRLNHFMRLKTRHSRNSFILVGPHTHSYFGGLAVEFQPLNHNEEKSKAAVQPRKDQNVASIPTSTAKGSFNGTIANAPSNKQAVEVIQLSDSPQERAQTFYDQLPLISVYNGDRKFYTPTFIFPNVSIKDEESRTTFLSKAEETKKQIAAQEIMEPRPRNKHLYCGVCKEPFQEYLGHVKGKNHQQKSRKSPFTQHIKTLELQMNVGAGKKEREKQMKKMKAKEERNRKREESQKAKSESGKVAVASQEKHEKQGKAELQAQCKIQAKIEARQSKTQSMSSSSHKQKIYKKRKSKKRQTSKQEKSKSKKALKSDSDQSESSPSRSREKKPRKKAEEKLKLQQVKKKRGRPSKKDLEARKQRQQLLPARKK